MITPQIQLNSHDTSVQPRGQYLPESIRFKSIQPGVAVDESFLTPHIAAWPASGWPSRAALIPSTTHSGDRFAVRSRPPAASSIGVAVRGYAVLASGRIAAAVKALHVGQSWINRDQFTIGSGC